MSLSRSAVAAPLVVSSVPPSRTHASTALIAHGVAAAPITTVAVAADGALVAVGDASGGLGVWRLARAASAPSAAAAGGIGAIGAGGGGGGGRPTLTLRGRLSANLGLK